MQMLSGVFEEVAGRLRVKYGDVSLFDCLSQNQSGVPGRMLILARIDWSVPVDHPKLKVRSLCQSIVFLEDRAIVYVIDIHTSSFDYADPSFPENLCRSLDV